MSARSLQSPTTPARLSIGISSDDLRTVRPEEAAAMLNWSVRTLERRSADGTGPKIIKISPRNRRVRCRAISSFLDKSEDDKAT